MFPLGECQSFAGGVLRPTRRSIGKNVTALGGRSRFTKPTREQGWKDEGSIERIPIREPLVYSTTKVASTPIQSIPRGRPIVFSAAHRLLNRTAGLIAPTCPCQSRRDVIFCHLSTHPHRQGGNEPSTPPSWSERQQPMKQSNSFLFKLCLSGMLLAVAVWPPYRAQEKTGTAEADYIIDTIAGGGTLADLIDPYGVAVDDTGNIYYVDFWDHRVLRIHPSGVIPTIVAGTGPGEGAGGGRGIRRGRWSGCGGAVVWSTGSGSGFNWKPLHRRFRQPSHSQGRSCRDHYHRRGDWIRGILAGTAARRCRHS